jgi:hypothetical protein
MKNVLGVVALIFFCPQVVLAQSASSFNYFVGTQTFEPKYQFSKDSRLVETAQAIGKLNSNIIKFTMAPNAFETYGLPKNSKIKSLQDFAEFDPSVQSIFKSPFSYYFIWTYRHSAKENNYWRGGMSPKDQEDEYREIYDFASYLLTTYGNSNKAFYLGHWEGDWSLLGGFDNHAEPTDVAIQGMIDWLNIRQKAIQDARKAHPKSRAAVYGYTEVNLVTKAMAGKKTVTNSVLPKVDVDFVSYSCWDSLDVSKGEAAMMAQLRQSLDYIESKMMRELRDGKKVFIGEFGFPLAVVKTQQAQSRLSREFIGATLEWGCPFILYWQMYENEANEGDNGRGQGLIDNKGQMTLLHNVLRDFLQDAKSHVEESERHKGKPPDETEYRKFATKWLSERKLD